MSWHQFHDWAEMKMLVLIVSLLLLPICFGQGIHRYDGGRNSGHACIAQNKYVLDKA